MRPGANGELIFEGGTEARVAATLLLAENESFASLVAAFEPPLQQPYIGPLEFLSRRVEDKIGTGDRTEHKIHDPRIANIAAEAIAFSAMPGCLFMFGPSVIPGAMRRKGFMRARIAAFYNEAGPPESISD